MTSFARAAAASLVVTGLLLPLSATAQQQPAPTAPTAPGAPPAAPVTPPVPSAPPTQATPPAGPGTKLTGQQGMAMLEGNTIAGQIDGSDYVIFLDKGGGLKFQIDGDTSEGKWLLKGEQICFEIPDEDEDCYRFEVIGAAVTLFDDEGTAFKMDILPGNARKL